MKLATWNVNSLKVRLPQLEQLLAAEQWDLVCLQETKTTDEHFPHERLAQLGYRALHLGQPTYNGVAVLARIETVKELRCVQAGLPEFHDPQQRFLLAQADDLLIASAYAPNGQSLDSDKYRYKLQWLEALHRALLASGWAREPFVLAGDFNIAPEDRDVHDPTLWQGQVLCSDPEREAWRRLLSSGLQDAFRLHHANATQYTWWDYRQLAFPRNRGLRIDHILLGGGLADRSVDCRVLREARKGNKPSDHAPVVVQLRSKDS